jgi:hypothetical protein
MLSIHPRRSLSVLVLLVVSGCATTALETASSGTWHEVRTPRFRAWTDGDPAQAAELLTDLEHFHRIVLKTTSAQEREGTPPLSILIARNQDTFNAWTGKRVKGLVGLFRVTPLGNFAFVTSQGLSEVKEGEITARHILFHEYTHYLMASSGARVPLWYNEGFAEFMAATELHDDGGYRLGCPPVYRTRWAEYLRWLPLQQLMEQDDFIGMHHSRRDDAYAQSWYAVHYFNQDSARQQQLARYLELVGGGVPSTKAVKEAFKLEYAQLDQVLREHSQKTSFECVEVQPAKLEQAAEPEVRALSQADAHYRVAQLLLASYAERDAAREALDAVLEGHPRHAGALGALARMHIRAGEAEHDEGRDPAADFARAGQLLKDAHAIERDDPELFAIQGNLALARVNVALKRGDEPAARSAIDAARSAYRKAVQHDSAQAEALWGLGYTYLMTDDGAEEGQIALEGAAYLLPLQANIAFQLGKLHIARKQYSQALPPLEHAERWARDEGERTEVRELIAKARAGAKAR